MGLSLAVAALGSAVKARWLSRNPGGELGQCGVGAQRLRRIKLPRQFSLGQRAVNFIVANLMQHNARPLCAPF